VLDLNLVDVVIGWRWRFLTSPSLPNGFFCLLNRDDLLRFEWEARSLRGPGKKQDLLGIF
jgi:hypothetical protein